MSVDDSSPFKAQFLVCTFALSVPVFTRATYQWTPFSATLSAHPNGLFNIHFIITFPTTLRSPSWSFPFWCSEYASYTLRPSYYTSYHSPANIWSRLQIVDFTTRVQLLFIHLVIISCFVQIFSSTPVLQHPLSLLFS
jgi:hypothetical protein